MPPTHVAFPGSLKVSTVAVVLVRVSVLRQGGGGPSFSAAVVPPALSVNVIVFGSPRLGVPTGASVAVPAQVPANAAGMVAPVTRAGVLAGVVAAGALLVCAAAELLVTVPFAMPFLVGGELRVSSTTPPAMRAITTTVAQAARTGRLRERRDRCGTAPGMDSCV